MKLRFIKQFEIIRFTKDNFEEVVEFLGKHYDHASANNQIINYFRDPNTRETYSHLPIPDMLETYSYLAIGDYLAKHELFGILSFTPDEMKEYFDFEG